MVWGGIIALAQVADATQNAMTFTARYPATSALSMTLDALFIDWRPMRVPTLRPPTGFPPMTTKPSAGARDGSIPQTTLRIPMPVGAKLPPASPAPKPESAAKEK